MQLKQLQSLIVKAKLDKMSYYYKDDLYNRPDERERKYCIIVKG